MLYPALCHANGRYRRRVGNAEGSYRYTKDTDLEGSYHKYFALAFAYQYSVPCLEDVRFQPYVAEEAGQ